MGVIGVLLAALGGPGLALGAIALDSALLGWPETRDRLRQSSTLPGVVGGLPPLAALLLVSFGLLVGGPQAPDVATGLGIFGVGAALCISVPLALYSSWASLMSWRAKRAMDRLVDRRTREGERTKILNALAKARASGSNGLYTGTLMTTVHHFTRASMWDDIVQLLSDADLPRVGDAARRLLKVYAALATLHLGRADRSRRLLDSIDGKVHDARGEAWRAMLDAVVSAIEGRTDRTRQIVEELDPEHYALERRVALAHALAAEGKSIEARETLVKVRVELEPDLESLFLVPGPATPIATALRTGRDSPFR